jgi:hypothetical protein
MINEVSERFDLGILKVGGFHKVIQGDCEETLERDHLRKKMGFPCDIHLTFLDPPFNQDKDYAEVDDDLPEEEYWNWMTRITKEIYDLTSEGGVNLFYAKGKESRVCSPVSKRVGLEFSKSYRLEEKDVRGSWDHPFWQTVSNYCICNQRPTAQSLQSLAH